MELREEPEERPGGLEKDERARGGLPSLFWDSLVLLAFLLALTWAPWNSLKGSTFEELRVFGRGAAQSSVFDCKARGWSKWEGIHSSFSL